MSMPPSAESRHPAPRLGRLSAYLVAVVASAGCALARLALEPFFEERSSFLLFVPALMASAAMGGFLPALLATALGLAERTGRDAIDLPMGRQDMADYLGLTIETVSRMLTQLQHQAVVEFPASRRFRVKDWDSPERLAE